MKNKIIILILALVSFSCVRSLHWKYNYEQLHQASQQTLPPAQYDSLMEMSEYWYILKENWDCGTVKQSEIDSVENLLKKYIVEP